MCTQRRVLQRTLRVLFVSGTRRYETTTGTRRPRDEEEAERLRSSPLSIITSNNNWITLILV